MRQEKEAAKEVARERKMKKIKRNIVNNVEVEDTPFHVMTEAEPGIFGAEAQTDENMLGEVPFQAPVARMY